MDGPIVCGNIVDRSARVPVNEAVGGNVDEAQRADDAKEQVPESGNSPWIGGRAHVPSLVERADCRRPTGDTPRALRCYGRLSTPRVRRSENRAQRIA